MKSILYSVNLYEMYKNWSVIQITNVDRWWKLTIEREAIR